MNLPNFFLADLPPEAVLTPEMLHAACDTLRRNREKYLRHRSTKAIVHTLCETAADWLRPQSVFRRLALSNADACGFPPEILAQGLDDFFGRFTPENFQALIAQDFGNGMALGTGDHATRHFWRGPEFQFHIAAGNLPNPAWMSLVLGLLTHSAQFMKCARGGAFLPRLFAHSLYHADPKLGACIELAEWRGGNEALEAAVFAHADCVTATGSDPALASIRSRLKPSVRFIGYGQRVSFGYISREVLRAEMIAETVANAAKDVIAWNQNGCLSPQVLYVEERGEVESDDFAARLAAELARCETVLPRGKISMEEALAIASRRAIYESLAAHRADAKIWSSADSTAWTVVFEHDVSFRFSPLNRFIFVKPVPDVAMALRGADEVRGRVSTVGIAAASDKRHSLTKEFAWWGVARICPLGRMQLPPLTWRHDGRPALGDLVTWTDVEE